MARDELLNGTKLLGDFLLEREQFQEALDTFHLEDLFRVQFHVFIRVVSDLL